MEKQIIMLHKGRVHLFWTGGQSVALCQQPKPAHNSPKDDYANTNQPSFFPRNRRRAPRSYNCSAAMWKNKQVFFPGSRVFSLRAQLQYVWDIQTHTNTHHEKTWRNSKCIFTKWKKATYWGGVGVVSVWVHMCVCLWVYFLNTIYSLFLALPQALLARRVCLLNSTKSPLIVKPSLASKIHTVMH